MTEFEMLARLNFLENNVKYQAEKLAKANEKIAKIEAENKELKAELDRKTELLKLAASKTYGRSSERIVLDDSQITFFTDEEITAIKEEPTTVVETHVRRRKRTYKEIYGNLPETEVVYDLREDEKKCERCGSEMTLLKYNERIEIKTVPAQFEVIKHLTAVYVCKKCADALDKNGETSTVFKTALSPAPLIVGSPLSPSLAAYETFQKFAMHIPLNRIEWEYKMGGFKRPKQTICNNLLQLAELLEPLFELLHRELCRLKIIHTDETTMQVNFVEGHGRPVHGYFWVYCSGKYELKKIVLFEYCNGRASDYPCSFLKGFEGYGHCDGLRQYDDVIGLIRVGCWAHLRRYFFEAVNVQADRNDLSTVAGQGLVMINKIFRAEKKDPTKPHDDPGLTLDEIADIRKNKSAELINSFFDQCSRTSELFLPSRLTRKAVNYALNQRASLVRVLEDPRLELTNNAAERAIRPVTVGRKNWLFAQSEKGAKASAIFYSIIETAKASMLKPYEYLKWIFEQIQIGTAAVEREYSRVCQNGGNAMTNYKLWKALDEIAGQTSIEGSQRMLKFAELLKQGYEEDLSVLTWSISADPQGCQAYHAYIDTEYGRLMMCYTSKAHAMREWRRLPSFDHRMEGCLAAPLRDIMNNMFNKQAIFGLIFNSDDDEKYVMVPKVMLEFLMPGPKPKPDNFKEPD